MVVFLKMAPAKELIFLQTTIDVLLNIRMSAVNLRQQICVVRRPVPGTVVVTNAFVLELKWKLPVVSQ